MGEFEDREARYYLIGRLLLDGASREDLAQRFSVDLEYIDEAWRVSVEQLSWELCEKQHATYRELDVTELRTEIKFCLALLLDWREKLIGRGSARPAE